MRVSSCWMRNNFTDVVVMLPTGMHKSSFLMGSHVFRPNFIMSQRPRFIKMSELCFKHDSHFCSAVISHSFYGSAMDNTQVSDAFLVKSIFRF
jgi:hypothetical protein